MTARLPRTRTAVLATTAVAALALVLSLAGLGWLVLLLLANSPRAGGQVSPARVQMTHGQVAA